MNRTVYHMLRTLYVMFIFHRLYQLEEVVKKEKVTPTQLRSSSQLVLKP